jgi:hypothetical protein
MSSRRPTLEHTPVLAVVVLGGPSKLVEAVQRVVTVVANATVFTSEIKDAANQVTLVRPAAIVMSEEIYAFDSAEFAALARDVQAVLIALPTDGATVRQLQRELAPRIMDAFREYFRE